MDGTEDEAREERRDDAARAVLHKQGTARAEPTAQQLKRQHKDELALAVLHNRGDRRSIVQTIVREFRVRPTVTSMIFGCVQAGIGATILGAGASRAFTVIGGEGADQYIARGMGMAMTIGGLLALAGIARLGLLIEMLGLGIMSTGLFIYTFALFTGLGLNGYVAGTLSGWLSFGTLLRVILLTRAAKQLDLPSSD
jgi:hypothetical protein